MTERVGFARFMRFSLKRKCRRDHRQFSAVTQSPKEIQMPSAHVLFILDRSGSMASIRDDVIGGFNTFLDEQKKQPGDATLTFVQFDTQDPFEVVHRLLPIRDVPPLDEATFVPRAGTPLLDALGRGISDLAAALALLPKGKRPGKVIVAILTDGMENSSTEFKKHDIMKLIKEKTEKAGWQFVFLSADAAAIDEAADLGIARGAMQQFIGDPEGTAAAFRHLSRGVSDVRKGKKRRIGFADSESRAEVGEQRG